MLFLYLLIWSCDFSLVVDAVAYIHYFSNIELVLHTWNKLHFVMVHVKKVKVLVTQ